MFLLVHWPNTNRICKSTAINKLLRALYPNLTFPRLGWGSLLFLLFLSGCTTVRPIIKIGLIAPFEGLYRESGYAALDAMRQALAECTPPGLDVLPLALDDSGDPLQAQRAAQKLLVDPTIHAIVGPLLLDAVPAVATAIAQASNIREQNINKTNTPESSILWFIPALVAPEGGFADAQTNGWLKAEVDFIADNTRATRILLLGLPPIASAQVNAAIPVLRVDDLDTALASVAEGDALLWLGRPDIGARWLSALRLQQPNVDFWLSDQAGLDVFVAHTTDLNAIHWLIWTDSNYNQWSQLDETAIRPNDSIRYLTYRATCDALDALMRETSVSPLNRAAGWELRSQLIKRSGSE